MLFTTRWLSTIFTKCQGGAQAAISVEEVTTDSRSKLAKTLFIPLIGKNFDGHAYVEQAIDNGAVAVLWDESKDLPRFLPADFPVFFVKDTLEGLQKLSIHYRNKINPIVIGITGSNGKTTTKDMVASIVKTTYKTHFTQGNFNNHIGLPLIILGMARDTKVLVLEMGMSNFKEIDQLSKIARPNYAIITNIGESHLEYLRSREGIARAKLEIRNGMKEDSHLIIDGDEKLLECIHKQKNVITCGFDVNNTIVIDGLEIMHDGTIFTLSNQLTYKIPLLGKHHAQNATYAIILGEQLGIPYELINKGLLSLQLTSMRFELIKGKNDVSIINDAYNASPTSMKAAINVVKQMKGFKERVLVLGDIFELGERSKELHQSVADVISPPITAVFTYGDQINAISPIVSQRNPSIICHHFNSKEELLNKLQSYLKKDSLLVFKASRGMQFELFIEKIQKINNK